MPLPITVNKYKEPYDVYIGRGSYWGNPFPINEISGDTREVVIERYREHLRGLYSKDKGLFMSELNKLYGCRLGCFCKPKACHGDVIVEVYEKLIGE
ncbi:unknown function [Vibrio phage 166E36-1]